MSSAKSSRSVKATATKMMPAQAPSTFTLPTLSSMLAPALNMNTTANTPNAPCNCGCQTSTTVCLTFDTTWLQNLVNIFPKVQITNNNTCVDNDCEDCDDETGK